MDGRWQEWLRARRNVVLCLLCLVAGVVSCSRPPEKPWQDGRDLLRRVEPCWEEYLEAPPAEARRLAEKMVEICHEEFRRPVVKDRFIYAVMLPAYARLYCVNLALGERRQAEAILELAKCVRAQSLWCETRDSHTDVGEFLWQVRNFSREKLVWLVLGLDMKGNGGRLPRYVRENCQPFREVLARHGVECPAPAPGGEPVAGAEEGEEEAPGAAAVAIDADRAVTKTPACVRLCDAEDPAGRPRWRLPWGPSVEDPAKANEYLGRLVALAGEDPRRYDLGDGVAQWAEGTLEIDLPRRDGSAVRLKLRLFRGPAGGKERCRMCATVRREGEGRDAWGAMSAAEREGFRGLWKELAPDLQRMADEYAAGKCSWAPQVCEQWATFFRQAAGEFVPEQWFFGVEKWAEHCELTLVPHTGRLPMAGADGKPPAVMSWSVPMGSRQVPRDAETGECEAVQ